MTPIKGGRAWVTATGIVYDFSKASQRKQEKGGAQPTASGKPHAQTPKDGLRQAERAQGHVVRLNFAGAAQPAVRPKSKFKTRLNYLVGNDASRHASNVPAYAAVSLEGLWPGVGLRLAQGPEGLRLSFTAADAATLAKARVAVEGASVLTGRGEGAVVATSLGQRSLGSVAVSLGSARHAGQFSGGTVALAPARPVSQAHAAAASERGGGLVYSTFLGGSSSDGGKALALDASGAAYVTGHTASSDFPSTPGAYDEIRSGGTDAFVAKLSADGAALVYATYLGGSDTDEGEALALDADGAAHVTGFTYSSNFPTTPGAFDTTFNGGGGYYSRVDAFVAKLSGDGSTLVYSTFLGGHDKDIGQALAVDASGSAYVTGRALSPEFPTTPGAYDTSYNGASNFNGDAFVTKLSADGSALVYSSFLGGSGGDYGAGLALDASGAAYVTGLTGSSDFPATPGAYDTTFNGDGDVFVAKLSADGSALVYATFFGGSKSDSAYAVAVDASGAAYVAGDTWSSDFPTTPAAFDTSFNGGGLDIDTFVTKLSADGSAPAYSTFLGGSHYDSAFALTVDASGAAYVTGETDSDDFPTTPGAFNATYNGGGDAFVTKLLADGSALAYSTFLGGSQYDQGEAVTLDASGAAYVTGSVYSSDFPTTPGAYDTGYNSSGFATDTFITKIDLGGAASGIDLVATASPTTVAAGGSFTVNFSVHNDTADPVTGDLFFTASHSGSRVGKGQILTDTTVAAHGTRSGSYTQLVPATTAPGVYTYTLRVGQFPNSDVDKVSFTITVTGAEQARGRAAAWKGVTHH